ncbi:hypothetical protein LCGC14_2783740, partial [marine sediment metagenome]
TFDFKRWWVKYPERYSTIGKSPTDVWEFPIPVQGSWGNQYVRHFCPLPEGLIRQIIELCSDEGDTILDPFAGSGSVLSGAYLANRKFIGLDINPEYKAKFDKHIKTLQKERPIETSASAEEKALFSKTIKKLRLLKLPSVLLKSLRLQAPDVFSAINGLVAIPSTKSCDQSHKLWRITYTVYIKSGSKQSIEDEIIKRLKAKPLSKYGIQADLRFKVSKKPKSVRTLYEYPWTSTYKTQNKFEGKTYPFIASNVSFARKERELIEKYLD